GALGVAFALVLALWLTGALATAHARLRADLLRLGREPAPAPPQAFRELEPIAAAAMRVAGELAQRAERTAHERDDLALLLDSVTDGILQLRAGGRIVRANPAARRLLGLPADAEGKPV